MKLTDKCKEDFEKWYFKNYEDIVRRFYKLPISMQFGVYVDFFESVKIEIDLRFIYMLQSYERIVYFKDRQNSKDTTLYNKLHDTRQEARIEAIKKANEIYNELE